MPVLLVLFILIQMPPILTNLILTWANSYFIAILCYSSTICIILIKIETHSLLHKTPRNVCLRPRYIKSFPVKCHQPKPQTKFDSRHYPNSNNKTSPPHAHPPNNYAQHSL